MDRIKFKNSSKYKGIVQKLFVKKNQKVSEGQSLAVITTQVESFEIVSHIEGVIKNVYIYEKMVVSHGDTIFDIYTNKDIEKMLKKTKKEDLSIINEYDLIDEVVSEDTATMKVKDEEDEILDIEDENWFSVNDNLATTDINASIQKELATFNVEEKIEKMTQVTTEFNSSGLNLIDFAEETRDINSIDPNKAIKKELTQTIGLDEEMKVIDLELSSSNIVKEESLDLNLDESFDVTLEEKSISFDLEDALKEEEIENVEQIDILKESKYNQDDSIFEDEDDILTLDEKEENINDLNLNTVDNILVEKEEVIKPEIQNEFTFEMFDDGSDKVEIKDVINKMNFEESDFNLEKTATLDLDNPLEVKTDSVSSQELMEEIAKLTKQISSDVKNELNHFKINLNDLEIKQSQSLLDIDKYKEESNARFNELKDLILDNKAQKVYIDNIVEKVKFTNEIDKREIIKEVQDNVEFKLYKNKEPQVDLNKYKETVSKLHSDINKINHKLEKISKERQIVKPHPLDLRKIVRLDFEFNFKNLVQMYKMLKPTFDEQGTDLTFTPFFVSALNKVILNNDKINKIYKNEIGILFNKKTLVSDKIKIKDDSLYQIADKMQKINKENSISDCTFTINDLSTTGIKKSSFEINGNQLFTIAIGSLSLIDDKEIINISIVFDSNRIEIPEAINLIKDYHSILENPGFLV